jgi:hypothetical protein
LHDLESLAAYALRGDRPPPVPGLRAGGCDEGEEAKLREVAERRVPSSRCDEGSGSFAGEVALRQRAVARLCRGTGANLLGLPWGTGFLVANAYLITNNQAMPTAAVANQILAQFNYQADYDGLGHPVDIWRLDPDAFFHTNVALDFTIVKLKGKPIVVKWPIPRNGAPLAPALTGEAERVAEILNAAALRRPEVFVRYPGTKWGVLRLPKRALALSDGQQLTFMEHREARPDGATVLRSELTSVSAERVRYAMDVEPGLPGSPVFDEAWELVALHHAAGHPDLGYPGTWRHNEGVRLDAIVAHLRAHFGTSDPCILATLGL